MKFIQLYVRRSNDNRCEIKFKLKRAAGNLNCSSFATFVGGGTVWCCPASLQVSGEEGLKIFCVCSGINDILISM